MLDGKQQLAISVKGNCKKTIVIKVYEGAKYMKIKFNYTKKHRMEDQGKVQY